MFPNHLTFRGSEFKSWCSHREVLVPIFILIIKQTCHPGIRHLTASLDMPVKPGIWVDDTMTLPASLDMPVKPGLWVDDTMTLPASLDMPVKPGLWVDDTMTLPINYGMGLLSWLVTIPCNYRNNAAINSKLSAIATSSCWIALVQFALEIIKCVPRFIPVITDGAGNLSIPLPCLLGSNDSASQNVLMANTDVTHV